MTAYAMTKLTLPSLLVQASHGRWPKQAKNNAGTVPVPCTMSHCQLIDGVTVLFRTWKPHYVGWSVFPAARPGQTGLPSPEGGLLFSLRHFLTVRHMQGQWLPVGTCFAHLRISQTLTTASTVSPVFGTVHPQTYLL